MQLATVPAPKLPIEPKSKIPLRVKGKLFDAIELIVFDGLPLDEAAKQAGLTTFKLRQAFARPHVVAHLKARREVLRAAASGKNILRLCEIRDADDNMPAVNAIKVLEQLGDEATARNIGLSPSPGVTICIIQQAAPAPGQTYPSNMSHPNVKQIKDIDHEPR